MNEVTPVEEEVEITSGYVHMAFIIWLFNLRQSFPDDEILLAFIDIVSCFRWPRIHPHLVGAFGFIIGTMFLQQMQWFLEVWLQKHLGSPSNGLYQRYPYLILVTNVC